MRTGAQQFAFRTHVRMFLGDGRDQIADALIDAVCRDYPTDRPEWIAERLWRMWRGTHNDGRADAPQA